MRLMDEALGLAREWRGLPAHMRLAGEFVPTGLLEQPGRIAGLAGLPA